MIYPGFENINLDTVYEIAPTTLLLYLVCLFSTSSLRDLSTL